MCICINCRHVRNCITYQLVQKQHQQDIYLSTLFFIPSDTIIQININSYPTSSKLDWDLIECLSFVEQPGQWLLSSSNQLRKSG